MPRRARRRRRSRRLVLGAMVASVAALAAVVSVQPVPRLMWNGSASAPLGLYRIEPVEVLGRGDLVLVMPPESPRALAEMREYLPSGVPLVKRIAGLPGDEVCVASGRMHVNGRHMADALQQDSLGRRLVAWSGADCSRVVSCWC